MTATLAQIWRYPVKAHGREQIDMVDLSQNEAMPWDRQWAVAHERSCFDVDRPRWQPCNEFSRGAKSPRLQAITCWTDPAYRTITFSHPDKVDITINPDDHGDQCLFIQWVMTISNGARLLPSRLVKAPTHMMDTDFPSISLINLASHAAVRDAMDHADFETPRWRGNFLIDGLPAWEEQTWVGKEIALGEAKLRIEEPITRCMATTANTDTGKRDADTLDVLRNQFGHQEMGVYARVIQSGLVKQGDTFKVL